MVEWLEDSPARDGGAQMGLRSLASSASSRGSPGQLMDRIVGAAGRAAMCSSGIVWWGPPHGLEPRGWWGPVMALQQHGPAQGAALAVSENKEVLVRSIEWDPDISTTNSCETLSVPIPPAGPPAGALALTRPTTSGGFTEEERAIALMAASLIGIVMDRSIHEEDSDPEGTLHAQRLEILGRLAASAAHDLNNLLMAIDGYAQMLADEPLLEEQAAGDIRAIRQATSRSIELVRTLLDFSRSESRGAETIDANTVIRGIWRLLDQVAGVGIAVTLKLSAQPLTVTIDSVQLEQVIVNLVANARDASSTGGEVEIRTSSVPSTPDGPTGALVRITVKDSGSGISDEVRDRIFDPFFTTKARGSGTGLGLATVNEIIRRAEGSIDVESESGKGTTFVIMLPATS